MALMGTDAGNRKVYWRSVRFGVLILVGHCLTTGAAIADDYLLRLDAVGYVDELKSEETPKETLLHRIEVVARAEAAFYGKVKVGRETLTFSGRLRPSENGDFRVDLNYEHATDTGETVPTPDGREDPVYDRQSIKTSLAVTLGEAQTVGGFETTNTDVTKSGERTRISKTRHELLLTKFEPARN